MTKAISRVCIIFALVFFGFILINTSFISMPIVALAVIIGTFLFNACLFYLLKKYLKPLKHFGLGLFLVRLVLCLFFIIITTAEPVQDFLRMYTAGRDISVGSLAYLENDYFYRFPYQTGFSAYQGLILFLFGGNVIALKLLNAVFISVSALLVYLISREFVSEKSAQITGIFYLIYPAPLYLAGVLTNQHLAVMLLFLAVYILIKKQSPQRFCLSGIILSLSDAMWPVGVIAFIAGTLFGIYKLLERFDFKRLLSAVLFPSGYLVTGFLLSALVVSTGLNPEGLANNRPNWMFVVGLSENGSWNKADYDLLMFLPEEEVDSEMSKVATERVKSYGFSGMLSLFARKTSIMWGNFEDLSWGFGDRSGTGWTYIKGAMSAYEKGAFLFTLALAGLGLVKSFGKKLSAELLPILIFCGYFAVYLIIEVQTRYKYAPTVALFCLMALGAEYLRKNE